MVKSMTPEEYARLFGQKSNSASNGNAPVPQLEEGTPELTEDEINLIAEQTLAGYDKKFIRESWQDNDIVHLLEHFDRRIEDGVEAPGLANFSEMGCYKTSTGLWLADELLNQPKERNPLSAPKLQREKFPSILIISSKGGKGTFLEALPEILPDWTIINVETQALFYYKDGHMLKLSKDVKFVPKEFGMPTICLAHYPIFARSNYGKFETDDKGLPLQLEGKFLFKEWLQADYIANREWDVVWCDEFHRLKDKDSKWTVNIKKIPAKVAKHGSTGTGFINRPDEIWSLLNWLDPEEYPSYWAFYEEFCNTPDAPIWMSDLSFKPLGEIQVGDKVVGWSRDIKDGNWTRAGERILKESEVLAIKRSIRPVVKVTMKSGRIIKCTPDHLWLSARSHGNCEDFYTDVLGSRTGVNQIPQLIRVIDPTPPLVGKQKEFAAAYIGAMMDGEGTWPIIAQSKTHNPEVHARIGEMLDTLGFNWNYEYKDSDECKFRINGLNGKVGIPGNIRNLAARQKATDFLNWCNPAKRRKIVNSVLGKGRWRLPDEVVSVESIGEQEVICMKTTTGNYVAWGYASKNCEIDDYDGYAKVTGCKPAKLEEFRRIVREIGVRRTLDEVMPDIKTPIFQPVVVELNATQRKMYNDLKAELEAEDQKGTPLYAANVLSMLQRLRQICVGTPEVIDDYFDADLDRRVQKIKLVEPSSKLDAVMEILEDLQWDDEKKEPLVVFSNFKDPLELFKARLDKHNENAVEMGLADMVYKYLHLDVGDSDVERYHKWHDEFPKLEYRVFMSTLQLGGESINLTPARHVVFLDRSWSPKDNAQGIGRIRRPGQEGQPVVIHINAVNTTDRYIERVNDVKQGWFAQIFGNEQ